MSIKSKSLSRIHIQPRAGRVVGRKRGQKDGGGFPLLETSRLDPGPWTGRHSLGVTVFTLTVWGGVEGARVWDQMCEVHAGE